jgi:hypothetical protein
MLFPKIGFRGRVGSIFAAPGNYQLTTGDEILLIFSQPFDSLWRQKQERVRLVQAGLNK